MWPVDLLLYIIKFDAFFPFLEKEEGNRNKVDFMITF